MPSDNHHPLVAAAARRSAATRQAAVDTLRQLDAAGTPITFTAVATEAGVSRSWLYRDPQIRAEIQRLRAAAPQPATPAAQRTSDASLRERIQTLLDDNRTLRQENRRLQDQIATLLGHQRADNTPRPRSVTPTGPCN